MLRRSSTSDFIPFCTRFPTASVSSAADVSLTGLNWTYPTLSSSIIATCTERMWIVARFSLNVSGCSTPTRCTRSSTFVPG